MVHLVYEQVLHWKSQVTKGRAWASHDWLSRTANARHFAPGKSYRVFSHDVTAAILVSLDNETAAMLVSQNGPVGVELFSYANALFCSNKFA